MVLSSKFYDDTFVKVTVSEVNATHEEGGDIESEAYGGWMKKATGEFSRPQMIGADLLKKLYPKHSLVMCEDCGSSILQFADAQHTPLKPDELITNVVYIPLAHKISGVPGVLVDAVEFGCFKTVWNNHEFITYIVKYHQYLFDKLQTYVLYDGPENPARDFLQAMGAWSMELHQEIWTFDQGFWTRDHSLWEDVQEANWDDIILDEAFKKNLREDVAGFFESEKLYKKLRIPWKRGLIMYGPPGNGKTVTLKAILKTMQEKGRNPLYVKTFQSWMGEEYSIQRVFDKARQVAPCILILEDLDSIIHDKIRSFFFNQVDGIASNAGVFIIGTTNHFERLDPGLSLRPSRFDRKYEFDDPKRDERAMYAKYWQDKLLDNDEVDFPDSLVTEISDLTYGFSFAFLKECFVSSLVLILEGKKKVSFDQLIRVQIKELRKQLDADKPSLRVDITKSVQTRSICHNSHGYFPPRPDIWETERAMAAISLGTQSEVNHERVFAA